MDMGLALHKVFQQAGLPAPQMHMDLPLGDDRVDTRWIYDVLCALLPTIKQFDLSLDDGQSFHNPVREGFAD